MNHLFVWNMPRNSASVETFQCYFHSCGHKRITHLTIFSLSEFSPSRPPPSITINTSSSNINISLAISKQNYFSNKSLGNGNFGRGTNSTAEPRNHVSIMAKNKLCSINRSKKPSLLKKVLFGSKKSRSIILLNIITLVYASNIVVLKEVEAFTDPAYFSAVRFGMSMIPFLPFMFEKRNDARTRSCGVELGLWVSLGYLSEAIGLLTSDVGRASFISLFTVIVIPLLESILGEIVPARTWFGILMSVIGISLLECSGSPPNIGDLFNFLSALFFGIHTLRTEHISRTTRKENLLALLGYEVGVVAVMSTVWCVMGANMDSSNSDGMICWTWSWFWDWIVAFPWIPALYTGVFSTGLCLWGEIAAMREVSATETALIYGLEPLWGAAFAWFLLGERWGIAGWIGAALILGGSLTVQMLGATSSGSESSKEKEREALVQVSVSDSDDDKKQIQKRQLSASPVMVRSSQDNVMTDIYKK